MLCLIHTNCSTSANDLRLAEVSFPEEGEKSVYKQALCNILEAEQSFATKLFIAKLYIVENHCFREQPLGIRETGADAVDLRSEILKFMFVLGYEICNDFRAGV